MLVRYTYHMLLSKPDMQSLLPTVPDWQQVDTTLVRQFTFANFIDALAFINKVGVFAEELQHHPDIENSYNVVTLKLTTHDAGGLTEKDFELAKQINTIAII